MKGVREIFPAPFDPQGGGRVDKFSRLRTILVVVIPYLIFSVLWILLSDRLVLQAYGEDALSTTQVQSTKGLGFVLLSALLIFYVLLLELRRREAEEREHRAETGRYIRRLREKNTEMEEAYETIIRGWAMALELRDLETAGHSRRVTAMMEFMGEKFGFSASELRMARYGAILHDIGKMGIPDAVLLKPGPLTREERRLIERHPAYAVALLNQLPYLQQVIAIPSYHHERWDGSGYPLGLRGEEVPLPARIFAVVDVADAISHNRCYHKAMPIDEVYRYLEEETGALFDPEVVRVFVENDLLRKAERLAAGPEWDAEKLLSQDFSDPRQASPA